MAFPQHNPLKKKEKEKLGYMAVTSFCFLVFLLLEINHLRSPFHFSDIFVDVSRYKLDLETDFVTINSRMYQLLV